MFQTNRWVLVCVSSIMTVLGLSGCSSQVGKEPQRTESKSTEAKSTEAKTADVPVKQKAPSDEAKSTAEQKPVGEKMPVVKLTPATVEDGVWETDFEAAKAKAKAEKKLLLVDFTGSDWCSWCIKLKQEVFDHDAFKTEAPKQFVCVELDFPKQKEIPEQLKEQNTKLSEQYKVQGFPTILVMDSEGEVIARTGYRPGGPEEYIKGLGELVKTYEKVVAIRPQLEKAEGLERAKLLDQLIDAYDKLGNESEDTAKWVAEIVALDGEGKAGLKPKYEHRMLMAEATKLIADKKYDEAKALFDKALAITSLTPEQKQETYLAQGEVFFRLNDFAGLVGCLKKAQETLPDGPMAEQIKQLLDRFKEIGDAQEAIAKLKADLEKAEGLERAKLLDQLVDAQTKLSKSPVGGVAPAELAKMSKEIIALDADNKAGLKQKHEVRATLADVMNLASEGKTAEAIALLEKAVALPDLPGEQLQELQCALGNCYLMTGEAQKGLESLKKAIETAPQGRLVPAITKMMRFAEEMIEKQKQQGSKEPEAGAMEQPKADQPPK